MIEWIPVSERLPEERGQYLVTNHLRSIDRYNIEILSYCDEIGFHFYDSEYGDIPIEGVTAWAMLPEPYREEEQ